MYRVINLTTGETTVHSTVLEAKQFAGTLLEKHQLWRIVMV